jgi:hypothetical protein
VTGNKTFCIYLAEDEAAIREHAELSGFPATVVTEVTAMIDPTTQTSRSPLTRDVRPVRVGRPRVH